MSANAEIPVSERLLKGAAVLGRLWKSGKRCAQGWSVACYCEPGTEFCKAKGRWLGLLASEHRDSPEASAEFYLIEMMTAAEFEMSGLTMTVEIPELGTVKVGLNGNISWADFMGKGKLTRADIDVVAKVLAQFPGAVVIDKEIAMEHSP